MLSLEHSLGGLPGSASPSAISVGRGAAAWVIEQTHVCVCRPGRANLLLLPPAPFEPLAAVALSPDGLWVAAASGSAVAVWALAASAAAGAGAAGAGAGRVPPAVFVSPAGCVAVAFSPDGCWLAAVGQPGERALALWRVRGATSNGAGAAKHHVANGGATPPLSSLAAVGRVSQRVRALAWAPDGASLVTAGDRHLKWWALAAVTGAGGGGGAAPALLASAPGIMSESGSAFAAVVDVVQFRNQIMRRFRFHQQKCLLPESLRLGRFEGG